ncbi:vWA domain-containing protein [Cognatiluteimonas weifangensis]|uniref:VWA domain-containing protein n=1 Tax=Cognatiluteimonas weifangensis TaxID=2303539 RepID=A0A372DR01_9GAMM|nr:VWA domain-containing protein [Luteimonas weifangensis]RFP61986.1 VWA domain-containing protein [Luteimonas weifangensis]
MSMDFLAASAASLSALHFLRPQWLWALLALPLLAWWWRRRRRQRSVWRRAVDPHLLAHLLDRPGARADGGGWLLLAGAALALCALAGPSWQRVEQPLWQSRAPLVLALDLSGAVLADDLPPSRLAQARAKLARLLRARGDGQVGLLVFADDAYTVAPLTDDTGNVALFLGALAPDIMPTYGQPLDGSRADRAIERAEQLLRQAGFDRGDILLLTDHADADARAAAAAAARAGYRVSALGLGTGAGAAYREGDGRIAQARLNADALRALATAGGGAYAALAADDRDLAALRVLDPQSAGALAAHGGTASLWRDQGYWLLLPLLLLASFAFRRGGALAALLLCVWWPLQPAHAAGNDWWRRPDQQVHQRLEQGAQAYRRQDFAAAAKHWEGLPGADAAYNRGNALARQGRYDAALAAYDAALRLQPDMADAIANRKAVEAARKRQPPPGAQSGDKPGKDQPAQADGQRPSQDGQRPGSGKADATAPGARQPPAPAPQSSPGDSRTETRPDKPVDAQAQRAADAAQRARMQQALRDAGQARGAQQAQAQRASGRDETPAQRERRLANEAWLRRVPDDPGGLLRARFRLEYERRRQGGD